MRREARSSQRSGTTRSEAAGASGAPGGVRRRDHVRLLFGDDLRKPRAADVVGPSNTGRHSVKQLPGDVPCQQAPAIASLAAVAISNGPSPRRPAP